MADCNTYADWISLEMDGELEPDAKTALDLHRQDCAACRERTADYARLREGLQKLPEHQAPPLKQPAKRPLWLRAAVVLVLVAGAAALWNSRPLRVPLPEQTLADGRLRFSTPTLHGGANRAGFRLVLDSDRATTVHCVISYDGDGNGQDEAQDVFAYEVDAVPGPQEFTHDGAGVRSGQPLPRRGGKTHVQLSCEPAASLRIHAGSELVLPGVRVAEDAPAAVQHIFSALGHNREDIVRPWAARAKYGESRLNTLQLSEGSLVKVNSFSTQQFQAGAGRRGAAASPHENVFGNDVVDFASFSAHQVSSGLEGTACGLAATDVKSGLDEKHACNLAASDVKSGLDEKHACNLAATDVTSGLDEKHACNLAASDILSGGFLFSGI